MLVAQDSMMRALQAGSQTSTRGVRTLTKTEADDVIQAKNSQPSVYVIEKYGRHEETRTPDLFRVKEAL